MFKEATTEVLCGAWDAEPPEMVGGRAGKCKPLRKTHTRTPETERRCARSVHLRLCMNCVDSVPQVAEITKEWCRTSLVDRLRTTYALMVEQREPQAKAALLDFVGQLEAAIACSCAPFPEVHAQMVGLLEDAKGQATEAISRPDYWKKWGMHYLGSLMRAHQLQQCNNFKDPGIQVRYATTTHLRPPLLCTPSQLSASPRWPTSLRTDCSPLPPLAGLRRRPVQGGPGYGRRCNRPGHSHAA